MVYANQYQRKYDYDLKEIAYRHLSIAMLISAVVVGLMVLLDVPIELYYIGSAVEMGIIFILLFAGLFRVQFSESTALIILNIFAIASSISLGFLVKISLYLGEGGVLAVFETFFVSGIVIFGIWGYTKTRKPDVSGLWKWLFVASIAFMIFAFVGIFIWSNSPLFYLIISGVGALLFAVYMFFDFARLERYEFNSPAMMALWLFYDIIFFIQYLLMFFLQMNNR